MTLTKVERDYAKIFHSGGTAKERIEKALNFPYFGRPGASIVAGKIYDLRNRLENFRQTICPVISAPMTAEHWQRKQASRVFDHVGSRIEKAVIEDLHIISPKLSTIESKVFISPNMPKLCTV